MNARTVTIVGAGSWGTTLAIRLARRTAKLRTGRVILYEFFPDVAREMKHRRTNRLFLPGFRFPRSLEISNNLKDCVRQSGLLFNAVPTQFIRNVWSTLDPGADIWRDQCLVNVSKGIEIKTGRTISQLFRELIPSLDQTRYAVLSGPSHAEEVIRDIPTAAVVAGSGTLPKQIQQFVSDRTFRLYTNEDVIGVEMGGALKNCIAIAAGICVGLGFGDNTLAAILTRGLAEITRLGVACGARRDTFAGLAGLGDLVVTCASRHSRNRRFGELLAGGRSRQWIEKNHRFVAEGVATSTAAVRLARRERVEIPIIEEVHRILYRRKSVRRAVESLLARPFRMERV